jgi:hypothetical protein
MNDPNLFVIGPNGAPIPKQFAPAFGITEPVAPAVPPAPEPTMPTPIVAPPAPPIPTPVAPPANSNAAPLFQQAAASPALKPPPTPMVGDATVNPFPAEPPAPKRSAPTTPLGMQQQSIEDRKTAAGMQADVESEAGRQEADARAAAAIEDDLAAKQRAAVRERENKEIDLARAKQQSALDAYVNHKVDQNRLWHNASTGAKIMAGIGLAMSGLGGALMARDRGGPVHNGALDMITKAIEDDVRLQMADRDKLGAVANMRRDQVSDLRQQFSDREAQYGAEVVARGRKVQSQIDLIAAKTKDPVAQAKLADFSAQLDGQLASTWEQAQQREIENRRAAKALQYQGAGVALGQSQFAYQKEKDTLDRALDARKLDLAEAAQIAAAKKADIDANKALSKEQRDAAKDELDMKLKLNERTVYGPDGEKLKSLNEKGDYIAGDAKRAGDLQKKITNSTTMIRLADELVRLRDQYGWSSDMVRSPEMQKMRQVLANMQLTEKDVKELGAISGSDLALITNVIGTDDPTSMRDPTPGVRKFRSSLVAGLDDDMRTNGIRFDAQKMFPEYTQMGVEEAAGMSPIGELVKTAKTPYSDPYPIVTQARDVAPPIGDALARTPGLEKFAGKGASRTSGHPNAAPLSPKAEAAIWGLLGPAAAGNEVALRALKVFAHDSNPRIRDLVNQIDKSNPRLGISK